MDLAEWIHLMRIEFNRKAMLMYYNQVEKQVKDLITILDQAIKN